MCVNEYGPSFALTTPPPHTHTHIRAHTLTRFKQHPQEIYQNLTDFEEALLENPLSMFIKYTFLYLVAGKLDGRCVP